MKIYRLETDDMLGPYAGGGPWVDASEGAAHNIPVPTSDPDLKEFWGWGRSDYTFGFQSLELLFVWFNSSTYRRVAQARGYRISVIDAYGDVRHGTFQSVFERDKRTTIQRITFEEAYQVIDHEELHRQENLASMYGRGQWPRRSQSMEEMVAEMDRVAASFAPPASVQNLPKTALEAVEEESPALTRKNQSIEAIAFDPELNPFAYSYT